MAPLLVFADDWGRHPSSIQHLVRNGLAGDPTLWVNTVGTRPPRFDLATLDRVRGKLRRENARPVAADDSSVRVLNPLMWPWLTHPFDRRLNRRLLLGQLVPVLRRLPEPPVAITTLPVVADLLGPLPVRKWVYYCVDDFGAWPGLDGPTMRKMERQVVERADLIIAAGENLRGRIRSMGREAEVLTHGVDQDFWRNPTVPFAPVETWPKPWVTFWGILDPRMDEETLTRLSGAMTEGTIVLAGPHQSPPAGVSNLWRVRFAGPVPFASLPGLARESSVLVMPYVDAAVTRAMQPLKLKEYLATGKPVVARDLPGNREWADALDLAGTPDEFARRVIERIAIGLPVSQAMARERLAAESWSAKAAAFRRMVGA